MWILASSRAVLLHNRWKLVDRSSRPAAWRAAMSLNVLWRACQRSYVSFPPTDVRPATARPESVKEPDD